MKYLDSPLPLSFDSYNVKDKIKEWTKGYNQPINKWDTEIQLRILLPVFCLYSGKQIVKVFS